MDARSAPSQSVCRAAVYRGALAEPHRDDGVVPEAAQTQMCTLLQIGKSTRVRVQLHLYADWGGKRRRLARGGTTTNSYYEEIVLLRRSLCLVSHWCVFSGLRRTNGEAQSHARRVLLCVIPSASDPESGPTTRNTSVIVDSSQSAVLPSASIRTRMARSALRRAWLVLTK